MMNSMDSGYGGPHMRVGPAGATMGGGGGGAAADMDSLSSSMPPPMRELNTSSYPPGIMTPRGEEALGGVPQGAPGPQGRYGGAGDGSGGAGGGGGGSGAEDFFSPSNEYYGSDQGDSAGGGGSQGPGRGQRLLHRMANDRYSRGRGSLQSPTTATGVNGAMDGASAGGGGGMGARRSYSMQYSSTSSRHHQYGGGSSRGFGGGGGGMPSSSSYRSRHYSGADYASDTEALHSPASVSSMRISRAIGRANSGAAGFAARSSSLPRTFQREALLRHPELSMEMDRLAQATDPSAILSGLSTDDQLSDSGAVSAPESVITARKRGEYYLPCMIYHFNNLYHLIMFQLDTDLRLPSPTFLMWLPHRTRAAAAPWVTSTTAPRRAPEPEPEQGREEGET